MENKELLADKEEFISIVKEKIKRTGVDQLLDFLETSDFFKAPASTKYHNSFEGGLFKHSMNVYKRLLKHCAEEKIEVDEESIAIVGLFHDLCKTNFYVKDFKNVKVYSETGSKYDEKGHYDWKTQEVYVVDEKFMFGHGEKSVFMLQTFIPLNTVEAQAIRYHMGGIEYGRPVDPTAMKVFSINKLALYTYLSDVEAAYNDEVGEQGAGDN